MKKQKFKVLTNKNNIFEVEGEIISIGDFKFGLYWDDNTIIAVELSTGYQALKKAKFGKTAPKQDLLNDLKIFVENGKLKTAVTTAIDNVNIQRERLQKQLNNFPVFPLNNI